MIYARGRFLFIHIPRTAGNSITEALSRACLGVTDVVIATNGKIGGIPFHRHATAIELKQVIPDWHSLYKFAIARDIVEMRDSEQRLIDRDIRSGNHLHHSANPDYKRLVNSLPKDRFLHHIKDPWSHWCCGSRGESLGVTAFPFNGLQYAWPAICEACGVDVVELRRLNC